MADVTSTFSALSSTESSNAPSGSTTIGAGLDDNIRMQSAHVAAWRDQTGWAGLTLTSVAGTNTITATLATAGSVTFGPTALASGQRFILTPANTNTGATTLNITSPNGGSALGAKNVFLANAALVGGELVASVPVEVVYDGTQFQIVGPISRQPTRTVLTSGSAATYTTPTGATRINVRLVGGGGGGGGATANNGTAGNNTTFGTLTGGGGGSGLAGSNAGGAGGTASGGDINIPGGSGNGGGTSSSNVAGGSGGNSAFGGGGGSAGTSAGSDGAANSGGGGGGGGGSAGATGGGGGAGGYVEKLITAPAATYTYTVGAAANGGTAGTNAGGKGAAGIIIVDEYYN